MIFLSYSHSESDYADLLERFLAEHHISVLRDKKDLPKNHSISEFMNRGSLANYVIVLVSNAYLRSEYCMFEILTTFRNMHRRQIIPIIFPDADVFSNSGHILYIKYWKDQFHNLSSQANQLPKHTSGHISNRLRDLSQYSEYIGDILAFLQDTNCFMPSNHRGELEKLLEYLYGDMLNQEIRPSTVPSATFELASSPILLAIDFGTSYTLAAVLDAYGNKHLIPSLAGMPLHRSTIEFTNTGEYRVGTLGTKTLRNIKRLIGVQNTVIVNDEQISVTLLIAMILKSVIRCAEEFTGQSIGHLLMSLPVDFTLRERNILTQCAQIAGVSVARFVPESSAETLLHSSVHGQEDSAVFIDLGGGTLDISLASIGDDVSDIRFTIGDKNFGSVDFDQRISQLLQKKLSTQYGIIATDLEILAEQVKREIGAAESVMVSYPHFTHSGNVKYLALCVTVAELEAATSDLIRLFDWHLSMLLNHFSTDPYFNKCKNPDYVFLTGQGTKLNLLRKQIAARFPNAKIIDQFQENAVIQGLSIQSQVLSGINQDSLLLDTFPSKLFIVFRGENIRFIDSDNTIPTMRRYRLPLTSNDQDTQDMTTVEVFEETVTRRKNNLFCVQFTPRPDWYYEIELDINANGRGEICLYERKQTADNDNLHVSIESHDLYTYSF